MSTLIVTRSDDGPSVTSVMKAIEQRGGTPIRFDTDLYPTDVRLSTCIDRGRVQRVLVTPKGRYDLNEVDGVWYRRFAAGKRLPMDMGDTREPSVTESKRTVYGTIAALDCFQVDPLTAVRKGDHKELQLRRAHELGLDVPRTLFSNDPDEVRRFYDELGGKMVTKMQSSFAVYREGEELVVFTTPVKPDDLKDLSSLRYCPMTFQEHLTKVVELRVTVIGRKAFAASIDSQQKKETSVDWRRDGSALLNEWKHYTLPPAVERGLLALVEDFGLNYAAADFVVTPEGRHAFLEINASGEWMWLQQSPGLPIAESLADLLLGKADRVANRG
jgi:glutathione synthase/RimK-type ligase-like ATP-grasp enzyme